MPASSAPRVPAAIMHRFCMDALTAAGVPEDGARITADSLIDAELAGLASHGVVRLLPAYVRRVRAGTMKAKPEIKILRQRPAAALIDGGAGLGQVVGRFAMGLAIKMARDSGAAAVGVQKSSHFGTGAFFVKPAIDAGMIGLALTNAPSNMPPAGGRAPFLGTNPFAIGIPCGEEKPLILDMSTSVVAKGKIIMAAKLGQKIPPGWAVDEHGKPTEDAAAAVRGAVLPMAGYKGAGLALVIDILCGALTRAAFGPHIVALYDEGDQVQDLGNFFAALDVSTFMPVAEFRARMDELVREVRGQPRQPGVDRIYMPGEIEQLKAEENAKLGIEMPDAGRKELDEMAGRLGIATVTERIARKAGKQGK
jgi:LDH2 family malate/lactate/ureidoglycolate dehydrogenase